jgi:O-antigen ligase
VTTTQTLEERTDAPSPPRAPAAGGPLGIPGWCVLAAAALLPVLYAPGLASPFWAPKVALLLTITLPGLLLLVRAAVRREPASLAAVAFLLACCLSAALADDPLASVTGLHDADGGLLFIAGCVAAWALARAASDAARRWLPVALLAGSGITAAVAWLQMTVGLPGDALAPWRGARAAALQGNPVFLGALVSAALCLAVAWTPLRRRWWACGGAVALFAGAVQLSGSRVALIPILGAVVWVWWRLGLRAVAVVVVAVVLGIGGAALVASTDDAATSRSAATSSDLSTRLDIWQLGGEAFLDGPLVGAGPARFRAVASPRWTLDLAQAHGPDVLLLDAHNVVVEHLVTVGLLGTLLGAAWIVLALRRVRGPLLGFAAALAVSWLVQPQGIDTTPLLLLALGAAWLPVRAEERGPVQESPGWRSALALALLPGLVAGVWLVAGERELYRGEHGSWSALQRADDMIGFFPVTQATITEREIARGLAGNRAAQQRAIASARRTAEQEPSRADWWIRLGEVEGEWGSTAAARRAFARALALNPWSVRAMEGLRILALDAGDRVGARRLADRLCRLSDATCPRDATP